jgi:hypothetical protein
MQVSRLGKTKCSERDKSFKTLEFQRHAAFANILCQLSFVEPGSPKPKLPVNRGIVNKAKFERK